MLRILISIQFSGIFKRMFGLARRTQKKSGAIKKILIGLLAVYVILSLIISLGFVFAQLARALAPAGLGWVYFAYTGFMILVFSFMGTIFAVHSHIYDAKDNDLLLSMPIKPKTVLLSRILSLLIFNYIYTLLIAVPAGAAFIYYGGFDLKRLVFFIAATLLLPFFSMTLCCIAGYFTGFIVSRMRRRALFSALLMIIFFVAYLMFFMNLQNYINGLIENAGDIGRTLSRMFLPLYSYGMAAAEGSLAQLFALLIFCVNPFILVYMLLSRSFVKIATTKRGAVKREYVAKEMKALGVRAALLKKEWQRFISLPMYVMNCSLGVVFEIILAGFLLFRQEAVNEALLEFSSYLPPLPLLACIALSMLSVMNETTAPSISLEGKNIFFLKSLPIKPLDVYMAKIWLNILVGLPSAVISAFVCLIVLKLSLVHFAFVLIIPLLAQSFTAFFGLFSNLLFPKFDWVNETAAIKQSLSVVIALFGGIAISAVPVAAVLALSGSGAVPLNALLFILAAAFAALNGVFYLYLKTAGQRRFATLAD